MKLNQRRAGVTLSYISLSLGYIVSIIYTPIMLNLLGQSEYGLYNLVASIVAYLGILNFGFGSAYIRYYSRYKVKNDKKNIAKLNGMFLTIFSLIGIISLLAGIILVFNIETILGTKITINEIRTAKFLVIILVLNIAFSFPNIVFNSHITANEKFIYQKLMQMVKVVSSPVLVLPVLYWGYGSVGMVLITTLINILMEIANIIFCFKKLNMVFSFKKFDMKLMKEMTIFSSFIFINMVIDQINWNIDKFIIGRFYGTKAVAVYGIAGQLNTYYLTLSTAISNVFIPKIHRMVVQSNNNVELTKLLTKIGRIQFIILSLISSGLVFFGKRFIIMWAGINYVESYSISLLLILPVTIPLIQNIGIEIQKAKNLHKFRSCIYFLIAIVNIILSIPLVKVYGGVGAAMGTALSLIIGNGFIMNWYYNTTVGLDMKYFWKHIISFVPSLIIPIITGILITRYVNLSNVFNFIIGGIIYTVVFCTSMWLLGINEYEKELALKPINKYIKTIAQRNK